MKKVKVLAIASVFAIFYSAAPAFAGGKNIVETASKAGSFNTLVELIQHAGLEDTLSGPGPFTVFAPTDEAFSKIPASTLEGLKNDKDKLRQVLTYHVVSGKVDSSKVKTLSSATTVEGSDVKINAGDKVMVNNASVTKADIYTSNGIIHVVDSVLMPTSSSDRARMGKSEKNY